MSEQENKLVPELRFREFINSGWLFLAIQDLIEEEVLLPPKDGNHGNIHPKTSDYVPAGLENIPFIMANDLRNGRVDFDNCSYLTKKQADALQKGFAKSGDVLLTHKGTVGETALLNEMEFSYVMLTPQVTYYRVNNREKLSNEFLVCIFNTGWFQRVLKTISGGGTRAYIGITEQRKLKIFLPTYVSEQQKIAACLTSIDNLITTQTQKLDTLKVHKKGLMQKLFPAEGESVPELRFGEFEGGWEKGCVGDLADLIMGNAFKSSDFVEYGVQLIRMGNLYNGSLQLERSPVYLPRSFEKEYSRFIIKPLELLMSMTGTVGKKDYGFVVQVPANCCNLMLNQRVVKITPKSQCVQSFLLQLLKSEAFLENLYSLPGGTKQANLSASQLKGLVVKYPKKEEQQKIAACLASIDNLITTQTQKLATLKDHKKGLMQKLFPSIDEE